MTDPERTPGLDPTRLRALVLEQSYRAGVGHIGPALSVVEIVATLFSGVVRGIGTDDESRERLVLSKGHAALTLYCALHMAGLIDASSLSTYCGDGSRFGVHPEHQTTGIDFTSGSLGQGLALAAGYAWAARHEGSDAKTYVIVSDAELNEGSTWEAVMFAAHHGLGNLVVVVDRNGQQAFGHTVTVLDLGDVAAKFREFGWNATEVDGHDVAELRAALDIATSDRPRVVVADTVGGHGVSFMEGKVEWHYLPLDRASYELAVREVTSQ